MKTCPQCLREVEDVELKCGYCGHELSNPAGATASHPQQSASPESAAQGTAPAAATKAAALNKAQRVLIVIASLILCAIAAASLIRLRPERQDSSAKVQPSAVAPGRSGTGEAHAIHPESDVPPPTKWSGRRQPGWASDGSRTISFQLDAENTIAVWMKNVRPVLAVRCFAGNTEVFVVTNWAATIEPTPELHTVHLSFDDGPPVAEQWLDSDSALALFAPDGVAVARQLARSHVMHFGFTPFNAAPATVQFDVTGFDQLVGSVAKTCRWTP